MQKNVHWKEFDRHVIESHTYDEYKGHDDDVNPDLAASIHGPMEHRHMQNEVMRHRQSNLWYEYDTTVVAVAN